MPIGGDYRLGEQTASGLSVAAVQPSYAPLDVMVPEDNTTYVDPITGLDADYREAELPPDAEITDEAIEKAEKALVDALQKGSDAAYDIGKAEKEFWHRARQLYAHENEDDDVNDPLAKRGLWIGIISKHVAISMAQMIGEHIPDPSAMDFFEFKAESVAASGVVDMLTAVARRTFRNMNPEKANGFTSTYAMMLTDLHCIGNTFATMSYATLQGKADDMGDGVTDGPCLQYWDPANVWPWRLDVDSISETFVTIWDPIAPDAIEDFDFHNMETVWEKEVIQPTEMRDEQARPESDYTDNVSDDTTDMLRRCIGIGHFPWHMVAQCYGEKRATHEFRQQTLAALAAKFGRSARNHEQVLWDPSTVTNETWWTMEWIGETLVSCRPYPLLLPLGRSPIIHDTFWKINGRLLGQGFYHRAEPLERIYNMLRRKQLTITGLAADPPVEIDRGLIDAAWWQINGYDLRLEPNMIIERISSLTNPQLASIPAIRPLQFNERAIPMIQNETVAIDGEIAAITGINDQMEGTSSEKTATESANNLQQGLTLTRAKNKLLEHGLLKEIVERVYCVNRQAIIELGQPIPVTMTSTTEGLQNAVLSPDQVMNLSEVSVIMTGMNSPGNRSAMLAALDRYLNRWMQVGGVDMVEAMTYEGKALGISGVERLQLAKPPEQLQQIIQDASRLYGPAGVEAVVRQLPAMLQQQLMGFVMSGGTGGPPPPSAPGAGGTGEQTAAGPPAGDPPAPPVNMLAGAGGQGETY